MDEGDQRAVQTHPRLSIDEFEARGSRICQGLRDVGNAISDVMESRPALGEKLAHGRIWARRTQELDFARPRVNKRSLDSVFLIPRPLDEFGAEGRAVQLDGFIQVRHRHTDVVNSSNHVNTCTSPLSSSGPVSPPSPSPPA